MTRFIPRTLATVLVPLVALLIAASPADARRKSKAPDDGLPAPEAVAEQARALYAELAGHANPLVRRVVYFGALELEDDDQRAAITQGIADADWTIKAHALTEALTRRDRKLKDTKKKAEKALSGLLESADETDRKHGYAILEKTTKRERDRLKAIERAAKDGSPDARAEARTRLIEQGGKTAWKVIEKGLAQPAGDPEHAQAKKALETFRDPIAQKWALANLHDTGDSGRLARIYLIEVTGKRVDAKLNKDLAKRYEKAAGSFEDRLRLAYVRAHRGAADEVLKTLVAGLRYNEEWSKVMAWQGLQASRSHKALGALRDRMMLLLEPEQAQAAFKWLELWAGKTGDPKVIEMLQDAARGDRPEPRKRAFEALTAIKHRESIALFENGLNEGRVEIRQAAARGIAAVARQGDEDRLAGFLRKEPTDEVKLLLIEALANIGTPETIDPLQFVITNRNVEIKRAAAAAIAATGHQKATMLLGLLKRDPDLDIRFMAWMALLELDPSGTTPAFKSGALRWLTPAHVEAMGQNPKVPNDLLLHIALEGGDQHRTFALSGLKARGADAATDLLTLYEKSGAADTSAGALAALVEIRGKDSLATYRTGLEAKQPEVRAVAIDGVGRFGPRGYLETLMQAFADRDARVKAEAARAAYRVSQRE